MVRALILACVVLACVANAEKVTPVEKVIELLKKLSAQTTEQGKVEAKQYDDFSCFCKEQADEKLYNIEKSTAKLEKLSTKISTFEDGIAATQTKESDEHSGYLVERADVT